MRNDEAPSLAEVKRARTVAEAILIQDRIQSLVSIPACVDSLLPSNLTGVNEQQPLETPDAWHQNADLRIIALDIAYCSISNLAVASGVLYRFRRSGRHAGILLEAALERSSGNLSNDGELLAEKVCTGEAHFPYQPGFLAFREIPLLSEVIDALLEHSFSKSGTESQMNNDNIRKDDVVLLCDGAGIAHPRFCGLACHLGVLYQLPSVGVAKNHLAGDYDASSLDSNRGSQALLRLEDRVVGSVLRSQTDIRPIFVSPGHLVSVTQATQLALQLCSKYRLPDPLRRADHIGRAHLRHIQMSNGSNSTF